MRWNRCGWTIPRWTCKKERSLRRQESSCERSNGFVKAEPAAVLPCLRSNALARSDRRSRLSHLNCRALHSSPTGLPYLTLFTSSAGDHKIMGSLPVRPSAPFARVALICLFASFCLNTAFTQTKPERQSKAAKPTQPAQNAPAVPNSPNAPNAANAENEDAKPEEKAFKGMKYRMIGPFRGGRSLTAAGVPGDATTYYFGATGGGVWKSTDGAMTWSSVFDKEGTSAIGSIAVAASNHNVLYVGTGEACIRGNISHGDGVYKTLDGGKTWKNVGLHGSRAIGKVIINPTNPDIAFVAALGHPYGPNTERGIFR